jgi:hypothetical protein
MGAAKIPEQINERIEDALLDADRQPDPVMDRLRALPVDRKIRPEENNVRRAVSPGALKGRRTIAMKMAINANLKLIHAKLDRLKSIRPIRGLEAATVDTEIAKLRKMIHALRRKLPPPPKPKKGRKAKKAKEKKARFRR